MAVRFGEFLLDEGARQLCRGGQPVALTPKAFDLLSALVRARPRVVTRAELKDHLWPRTFVAHSSLPRIVTEVRQALDDEPRRSRFVRTVRGHGYAFSFQGSEEPAAGPRSGCALSRGGQVVWLRVGENIIGRGEDSLVRSRSRQVSRRHAVVRVGPAGEATLEDLASRNGTFVAGRRIDQPLVLKDGDVVVVGPEAWTFLGPPPPGSTAGEDKGGV